MRAETRRFELLKALTPYLVSSEDLGIVLSLIYAYLTSLQYNYSFEFRPILPDPWAKHGQNQKPVAALAAVSRAFQYWTYQ